MEKVNKFKNTCDLVVEIARITAPELFSVRGKYKLPIRVDSSLETRNCVTAT